MKRPVSLVASLFLTLGVVGACSAAAAGKPQVTSACTAKMGSETKCACFADALEKGLTPEEFGTVAKAVDDNARFSELLPVSLHDNPKFAAVIGEASLTCFN
jgi:hypothetical protein